MRTTWFIIPCGGAKLEGRHAARDLYTGQAFRMQLEAALAEVDEAHVLILSAKHGLVTLDQQLDSYDVKMGDAGSVTADDLFNDLLDLGLDPEDDEVFAMLPKAYLAVLDAAARDLDIAVQTCFEAAPGIGHQRGVASKIIRHADMLEALADEFEALAIADLDGQVAITVDAAGTLTVTTAPVLLDPAVAAELIAAARAPLYYLGTHEPSWLTDAAMPGLFVTRTRFTRRKSWPAMVAPRLAIDSGGFSELMNHGRWTIEPARFAEFIEAAHAQYGARLDFVAPQDWLCHPDALKKTGLSVDEHQARTVESVATLRALLPAGLRRLVPVVLQGLAPEDYRRCGHRYATAGLDLEAEPMIAVGSLVRPVQATPTVLDILAVVCEFGRPFHAFGLKGDVLVQGYRTARELLASSDSTNWSYVARRRGICLPGHRHANCGNCPTWARQWHRDQVARLTLEAAELTGAAA